MIFSSPHVDVYPSIIDFPERSTRICATFFPEFDYDCYELDCDSCFVGHHEGCVGPIRDHLFNDTDLLLLHPELLL